MSTVDSILLGIQIGGQLGAAVYCIWIAMMPTSPTFPWVLIAFGLFARSVILIDNLTPFMTGDGKTIIRVIVSVSTFIAFRGIYKLMVHKSTKNLTI